MSQQKTWNLEVVQEIGLLLKLSLINIMYMFNVFSDE